MVIAELSDHTVAVGVDHLVYGWGFFAFVTVMLIVIGLRYRDPLERVPPPTIPDTATMAGPARFVTAAIVGMAVIGVAPAYALYLESTEPAIDRAAFAPPAPPSPWRLDAGDAAWRSTYDGADGEINVDYVAEDRRASLHLAFYAKQQRERELIQHSHRMDPGSWNRIGSDSATMTM